MENLKLTDFLEYQYLSGLAASPNKQRCAFVVSRCDLKSNGYRSTIHVLERSERRVWQLTGLGKEKSFAWLDDDTILFPSVRDEELKKKLDSGERWTCYQAISLSGGEAQEYMRIPLNIVRIVPVDADRFVLLALYQHGRTDPMQLEGEARANLLKEQKELDESYSVAEEIPFRLDWMGFTNGLRDRLYIFDRRDNKLTPVTDETQKVEFFEVKDGKLIFSAKHYGSDTPLIFQGNVAVYNIDTGKLTEYVDDNKYRTRFVGFMQDVPVFMGSTGERYYYQENPWFFEVNEKTGEVTCFAKNEYSAQNAVGTDVRYGGGTTIEATDDFIYYVGTEGGNALLKRVNREGHFDTLTYEPGSVDGFAVCEDEIIFIGLRDNRLQEIYCLSIDEGTEERISGFNDWVQDTRTLSTPKHLPFENAGVEMDGWVMEPVDFDPSRQYPAILYIHGGHKLCYGSIFFHELQLYANKGYFVVYANPRGSDGGDNDFANIIGKYGYDDYDDLMRFCDICLERYPQIDKKRFGVGGGSYGGYMTNWIIGHTNRFACAVSQRSIASLISMFGTSDTSYQFPVFAFNTDPWMDIERYWDHSPLKYANKAKTPTLFIHSSNDYRCPVSEGEQMFTALKYNRVEAKLCVFHGEGHELSRSGKPKNRVNRLKEIVGWFDTHIG